MSGSELTPKKRGIQAEETDTKKKSKMPLETNAKDKKVSESDDSEYYDSDFEIDMSDDEEDFIGDSNDEDSSENSEVMTRKIPEKK